VYSQYLRSKHSPKIRQDNEKAIATVEEAKAFFDSLGLDTLPTIQDLRVEYSALVQEKHNCQQARSDMKQYVFDLQSAKKTPKFCYVLSANPPTNAHKGKGNLTYCRNIVQWFFLWGLWFFLFRKRKHSGLALYISETAENAQSGNGVAVAF